LDDIRHLHGDQLTIWATDWALFEVDGFIRNRTHLLADDAGLLPRQCEAAALVDDGFADYLLTLFLEVERRDCLGRAGLSAGVAGIIALSETWRQYRRSEAFQTGFEYSGLDCTRWTGAHALVTACTAGEDDYIGVVFRRARRSQQVGRMAFGAQIAAKDSDSGDGSADRKKGIASIGVIGLAISERKAGTELDTDSGAGFDAFHAHRTFCGIAGVVLLRIDCAGGTICSA
jgi:hypothetical protein